MVGRISGLRTRCSHKQAVALKRALFIVWAIVIWQIAGWTFGRQPDAPPKPPEVDPRTNATEKYLVEGRDKQRQDGLRALEIPWSRICTEDGRKEFANRLGHYYYHRQNQMERYPENFGKTGAAYITQQWASADDKRIDRLTREAYSRGYLKPDDFEAVARKLIVSVVRDERITGKGCAR